LAHPALPAFPTRRSSDLTDCSDLISREFVMLRCRTDEVRQFIGVLLQIFFIKNPFGESAEESRHSIFQNFATRAKNSGRGINLRSEEHTSELQSRGHLVC